MNTVRYITCLCSENTRATKIFFRGHLIFLYRDLNELIEYVELTVVRKIWPEHSMIDKE